MVPRNATVVETRMQYEVTKANGSARSFDKYSRRWVGIDNFSAKYHLRSKQSSLNSHAMYLCGSMRVWYGSRRKRLHRTQHWAYWLLNVTHTRKITTPYIQSKVMGVATLPFWLNTALAVPMATGVNKTVTRYGDIFGNHWGWGRVGS